MDTINLVNSFTEFKEFKKIDRPTMIKILEDVFRTLIKKKYEDQKPLFGDSIKDTIITDNTAEFGFNGGEQSFALKGKTFAQIEESS